MIQSFLLVVFACTVIFPLCADQGKKNSIGKFVHSAEKQKNVSVKNHSGTLHLANQITAIIYTDSDPIVVTKIDVERKTLDGRTQTKQEAILNRLMYYQAVNFYKMPVSDESINSYLASIQEQHGFSERDIRQMFKNAGYTYDDAIESLRMSYAINGLVDMKIRSRLVVPEKDVIAYYKEHPEYEKKSYYVKHGVVSGKNMNEADFDKALKNGDLEHSFAVEWTAPFWLYDDEITENRSFIKTMGQGALFKIEKNDKEYEIIKLIKKKDRCKRTIEERYKDILETLRYPKYEELLKAYQKDLLSSFDIEYF